MPATTAIVPLASEERSASGASGVVDLGTATSVDLALDVTAISGSLVVYAETSKWATSGSWKRSTLFERTTTTGTREATAPDLERYLRLSWELTGTATFGVSGDAVFVYCRPRDMKRVVSENALFQNQDRNFSDVDLDMYAREATDDLGPSLGAMFDLPITTWGLDVRRKTAELAVYWALFRRGNNPDDAAGKAFRQMFNDVQQWKQEVREQEVELQGITDSTPAVEDGGAYIVTDSPRGWGR
ncbi:hypothetical protein [Sorangium sp. So ce1024]|uniref:hypothetical protein n=1 Tax=Sorangium sp. So ce1024 TaxID=3133327 RepID=UPI003F00AFDA